MSFELRKGEILGLYGLVGAGRTEAMQGLFGITPTTRGRVLLDGKPLAVHSPADAIHAGIAYVPEDRQDQGAVLSLGIRENITLANLRKYVRGLFLSRPAEQEETRRFGRRLAIKAANWEQRLAELSGGNQQKVVIAKWLATRPKVIVLDEPTKGIDIGSKAAVHDFIGELAEDGLAVVLISSELPEVMGLADRIIVMREGRMVEQFKRGQWSAEEIVGAATGARKEAA
jgi:rhamnose transport system ATP-binding protein